MNPILLALALTLTPSTAPAADPVAWLHAAVTSGELVADRALADSARQAPRPCGAVFRVAFGTWAGLAFADVGQTMFAEGRYPDKLREANPALAWTTGDPVLHGGFKGGLHVGAAYGLYELRQEHPRAACWAAVGMAGLQAWVVTSNAAHLREAGR